MKDAASPAGSDTPVDSDGLFALDAEVRSGANNLIFLSGLTMFCGLWLSPFLLAAGAIYLALSIALRVKQNRVVALALFGAALVPVVQALLALISRTSPTYQFGFAMPEIAPFVAGWTALRAFRLQRLLQAPLAPSRPRVRGV